ncbi:hypothetical protein WAI453_012469 [Rhynchosporium graminicola]
MIAMACSATAQRIDDKGCEEIDVQGNNGSCQNAGAFYHNVMMCTVTVQWCQLLYPTERPYQTADKTTSLENQASCKGKSEGDYCMPKVMCCPHAL